MAGVASTPVRVLGLASAGLPITGALGATQYTGQSAVIARSGGGVCRLGTIDPDHIFANYLGYELEKRGLLIPNTTISQETDFHRILNRVIAIVDATEG